MTDKMRAIIADDEPAYCDLFGKALERVGFSVTRVYDGKSAYHAILEEKPYVLVIDHQMPYLTGMEVLRGCAEQRLLVPVVVMVTGTHLRTSDHFRAAQPHVDLILSKPFSPSYLAEIVQKLIEPPVLS